MKKIFEIAVIIALLCSITGTVWADEVVESNDVEDLTELSLEELMEIPIVVSGSRQEQKITESTVPITVVTAEDIHYSGLTNIPDILQFYTGMDVLRVDRKRYSVGVRGLHDVHSEKLLVLIDGRTAESGLFGGPEWFRFPILLEDIKRIEIVRGPGGAAWGANAFTGAVNIITKDAEDEPEGWFASTSRNHFGDTYNHLRWSAKKGKLNWRISGGYNEYESSEDAIDDDNFTSRDFSRDNRVDTKFTYNMSEQTTWRGGFGYSNIVAGDYEFQRLFRMENNRYEMARTFIKAEHEFDDGTSGYLQYYHNYDLTHDHAFMRQWKFGNINSKDRLTRFYGKIIKPVSVRISAGHESIPTARDGMIMSLMANRLMSTGQDCL